MRASIGFKGLLGVLAIAMFGLGAPARAQTTAGVGVPLSAAEGGPRRWRVIGDGALELRKTPSPDAPVAGALAAGVLLNNEGCGADGAWCKVRAVRGGARGFAPASALAPAAGPDGAVPTGVNDSARRAGRRDFDARGSIACVQVRDRAMDTCAAGVARAGGGDATAVVTFGNGFRRTLHFVHGAFIDADATMSGTGKDIDWRLEDGVHLIRVDDQRYELPDDLVFGK